MLSDDGLSGCLSLSRVSVWQVALSCTVLRRRRAELICQRTKVTSMGDRLVILLRSKHWQPSVTSLPSLPQIQFAVGGVLFGPFFGGV